MGRKKKHPEHVNHERWLVSYADFITLLFAFFTTMYAISTVDAQKMGKMVMSMRASFDSTVFAPGSNTLSLSTGSGGGTPTGSEVVENIRVSSSAQVSDISMASLRDLKANALPTKQGPLAGKELGNLKRNVESLVGSEAMKGQVRTRLEGRGLVITLGEGGFFDSGSDQMKQEGRALLDTILTSLISVQNHIRVEGHTDNVPITTARFPSNWELSTARATSIVSYIVAKFGLTPDRLSAAGYAEFRPVATNDTEDGRARNRRVDIIVLDPGYARAEPR